MTRTKIKIAIIDSGIDSSVSDLSMYVKKSTGLCINEAGYIVEDATMHVRHPHGTLVALVIRDLCDNVEFTSINILNERLAADGRVLLRAIDLALTEKPDIVHLSLGTTSFRYWFAFKRLIKKARTVNSHIVAAANNQGKRSYPAYLGGVTGVKADARLENKYNYYYKSGFFYAPCETNSIKGINEIKAHIGGSSTAAAFISGQVACLLSVDVSNGKSKITYMLKNNQIYQRT